jgi:hypothetical protein
MSANTAFCLAESVRRRSRWPWFSYRSCVLWLKRAENNRCAMWLRVKLLISRSSGF